MLKRLRLIVWARLSRCSILPLAVVGFAVAAAAMGCNNSRYGVSYDARLPELKRIAVYPAAIEVSSRHTGGITERRPDLEPDVRTRVLAAVREVLVDRGVDVEALAPPPADSGVAEKIGAQLALLGAVRDAIITHHYQYGKSRVFEYPTGQAARAVLGAKQADAVLLVYLAGVVPTAGRQALAGTAVVVGVLTGIHFHVSTNEAVITLMLVDAQTGEVLWFNWYQDEANVRSERGLRHFVKRACSYLLKPRK